MKECTDKSKQDLPQVLVCQHGARRRYVVPRMLQDAGMLAAVYTDSSSHSLAGLLARGLGAFAPAAIRRLASRRISDIPSDRIRSSDAGLLCETLQQLTGRNKQGIELYMQRHRILSRRMKKWGLQGADVVYSMFYENLDFVRWAKSQGLKSIVDVYISPRTDEVMKQEAERFPLLDQRYNTQEMQTRTRLWNEAAELADLLICPSEWVAEGVISGAPWLMDKIRVVPYGCSIDFEGRSNEPVRGRVLFAGGDVVRKGLFYLAEATADLVKANPSLDVRVAGLLSSAVVSHPLCAHLNFLGKLSASEMKEEYLSADVFVLPSVSEGFAAVVAEAITAGCPVIVTKEVGSPITNGEEGFIIPSCDVSALKEAIQRMLTDHELRDRCSSVCKERCSFYSLDSWKQRLIKEIAGLF